VSKREFRTIPHICLSTDDHVLVGAGPRPAQATGVSLLGGFETRPYRPRTELIWRKRRSFHPRSALYRKVLRFAQDEGVGVGLKIA